MNRIGVISGPLSALAVAGCVLAALAGPPDAPRRAPTAAGWVLMYDQPGADHAEAVRYAVGTARQTVRKYCGAPNFHDPEEWAKMYREGITEEAYHLQLDQPMSEWVDEFSKHEYRECNHYLLPVPQLLGDYRKP